MKNLSYDQPVFDIPRNLYVLGSLIFYLLDSEPERFDRQTQGLVVACVDETDSTLNTDPVVGKNGLEAW